MRGIPFARAAFEVAKARMADGAANGLDAYIVHSQSWLSKADSSWGAAKHTNAVKARATAAREGLRERLVEGMSPYLPMSETPLYRAAMRLRGVEIRRIDAFELIREWMDDADAMIHIDPPYLPEVRRSQSDCLHEMTPEQHAEMLAMACDSRAHIAISGYPSHLYDSVLSDWHRRERTLTIRSAVGVNGQSKGGRANRQEVLWMNYDIISGAHRKADCNFVSRTDLADMGFQRLTGG